MVVVACRGYYDYGYSPQGRSISGSRRGTPCSGFGTTQRTQLRHQFASRARPLYRISSLGHNREEKNACSREEEAEEQKDSAFSGDFAKDELRVVRSVSKQEPHLTCRGLVGAEKLSLIHI